MRENLRLESSTECQRLVNKIALILLDVTRLCLLDVVDFFPPDSVDKKVTLIDLFRKEFNRCLLLGLVYRMLLVR